jgi:hypothetical protein
MTGIFFEVNREGQLVQVEIEHMTVLERERLLQMFHGDSLRRLIHQMCVTIVECEEKIQGKVQG